MISTGFPLNSGNKTEVIDLENGNVKCKDLEDFPIENSHAVYANLASMPIICGGWFWKCPDNCTQDPQNCPQNCPHSSDKCFIYKEGGWQHFVTIRDRRSVAAGIVYNNAFHIFGGHDTDENVKLQSSEIVYEDGTSTEGPQLPSPIHGHGIASINSTVSIISGGYNGAYIDQTWYFNHESQTFTPGPNMLEGRNSHSSGTITDQITKEKFVIVVGGYNGSSHLGLSYSDSTEILLNGEWSTGKTSYRIIELPVLVPYNIHNYAFLLVFQN